MTMLVRALAAARSARLLVGDKRKYVGSYIRIRHDTVAIYQSD